MQGDLPWFWDFALIKAVKKEVVVLGSAFSEFTARRVLGTI